MWFFWVYVIQGTQEKIKSYKIFTSFWFRNFSYTFWELILSREKRENWAVKKGVFFDLNQKFIPYKMKEAHIFNESNFWFKQNSDPGIFFYEEKNTASVPKSGVVIYCHVRLWLKWMMDRGQNTDFPEAKKLYHNIQEISLVIQCFGVTSFHLMRQGTTFGPMSNSSHQNLM